MHCGNLHDVADCKDVGVVSGVLELLVVGVDHRDDPVARHEHVEPVFGGVVVGDGHIVPSVFRRGKVAAQSTTQKDIGELRGVPMGGYHTAHHSHECRLHVVAVPAHLVVSDPVRITYASPGRFATAISCFLKFSQGLS